MDPFKLSDVLPKGRGNILNSERLIVIIMLSCNDMYQLIAIQVIKSDLLIC
jgi:hypothetical protein